MNRPVFQYIQSASYMHFRYRLLETDVKMISRIQGVSYADILSTDVYAITFKIGRAFTRDEVEANILDELGFDPVPPPLSRWAKIKAWFSRTRIGDLLGGW